LHLELHGLRQKEHEARHGVQRRLQRLQHDRNGHGATTGGSGRYNNNQINNNSNDHNNINNDNEKVRIFMFIK
jgi:hypothetical protein